MARGLASLDGPGQLNSATEQQQFLCQRGLTRVGMGDNGKGTAASRFLNQIGHGKVSVLNNGGIVTDQARQRATGLKKAALSAAFWVPL